MLLLQIGVHQRAIPLGSQSPFTLRVQEITLLIRTPTRRSVLGVMSITCLIGAIIGFFGSHDHAAYQPNLERTAQTAEDTIKPNHGNPITGFTTLERGNSRPSRHHSATLQTSFSPDTAWSRSNSSAFCARSSNVFPSTTLCLLGSMMPCSNRAGTISD